MTASVVARRLRHFLFSLLVRWQESGYVGLGKRGRGMRSRLGRILDGVLMSSPLALVTAIL